MSNILIMNHIIQHQMHTLLNIIKKKNNETLNFFQLIFNLKSIKFHFHRSIRRVGVLPYSLPTDKFCNTQFSLNTITMNTKKKKIMKIAFDKVNLNGK